jgi:hypothetical protein
MVWVPVGFPIMPVFKAGALTSVEVEAVELSKEPRVSSIAPLSWSAVRSFLPVAILVVATENLLGFAGES